MSLRTVLIGEFSASRAAPASRKSVRITTIGLQRRHLPRDAGIQQWMQASLSGCRRGICMEMLSARPRASTIGCGFVDDAALQARRHDVIVAQLPDPSLWIPRPTGLLHPVADGSVGKGNAGVGWRGVSGDKCQMEMRCAPTA